MKVMKGDRIKIHTSLLSQNSLPSARKHTQNSTVFDDGGNVNLNENVSYKTYAPLLPPIGVYVQIVSCCVFQ